MLKAKYSGRWKEGVPDGNGTFSYPDGRIYKGGWLDGVQVLQKIYCTEKNFASGLNILIYRMVLEP
jgi:hypothetical protein